MDDDGRGEGLGHAGDALGGEVDAELGQVGAVVAPGVEVDAGVAAADHLADEPVGELRRRASPAASPGTSG